LMRTLYRTKYLNLEYLPVFVYGTLRYGHGNFYAHLNGRVFDIVAAHIKGSIYPVRPSGGFPCLFLDEEGTVRGDLMYVHEDKYPHVMYALDGLEGEGYMYVRKKAMVDSAKGKSVLAWVYEWNLGRKGLGKKITSGDWNIFLNTQ
jgi:gamma-glutamylcyclotransferase (GGCT)/AIG2-like uncharacterized protein YtfP